MTTSKYVENTFDRLQLPLLIKSLCKPGRAEFFNMNKTNDQKPAASLILNGETSDLYHALFKSGIRGMPTKIDCFHSASVLEILSSKHTNDKNKNKEYKTVSMW